jgi:hypothetical protein
MNYQMSRPTLAVCQKMNPSALDLKNTVPYICASSPLFTALLNEKRHVWYFLKTLPQIK